MEKLNNKNSPVMQALLDLKAQGVHIDLDSITEEQLSNADIAFNRHQYPDRRITFTRVNNMKENKSIYALSPNEQAILLLFINSMSQQNLISVSIEILVKITTFSKPTVRKALNTLLENGFIAIHTKSKKNSPTIYMVNPDVAASGKGVSSNRFKELCKRDAIEAYKQLKNYLTFLEVVSVKNEHSENYSMLKYDFDKEKMYSTYVNSMCKK